MKPTFVKLTILSLIGGTFMLFSCSLKQDSSSAADGNELYVKYCATCHGTDLRGGMSKSLLDGVWQFGDGRGYVTRNIRDGIPSLGMPSFEKTLTQDEIESIVDYLYEAEAAAGAKKPDPPAMIETLDYEIETKIWADNMHIPWAIVFLNKDTALVTERPGSLRMVVGGKLLEDPVSGTPEVLHEGQGGLMDVNIDPAYASNGWIYLSYSHAIEKKLVNRRPPAMTRIVRGRIRDMKWTGEQVIYEAPHKTYRTTRHHYGNRIVFDKKGYLYFSIGDRGAQDQAQDPSRPNGKIHRIYPDGSIPDDNPFMDEGLPTLYTLGNRNPQGISVHPVTDEVWAVEHGPLGGDELNLIRKGVNYGWPVIT